MKIYQEISLTSFEFWGGACDTVKYLKREEIVLIESILEEIFPEGVFETTINDFFWFEEDTIAEWLGYNNFDEIIKERR